MRTSRESVVVLVGLLVVALSVMAQTDSSQTDEGAVPPPLPPPSVPCPVVIDGSLGAGSPSWPSTSGNQDARLNRNGVGSTCAAPKVCDIFALGTFPFDAYEIPNGAGTTTCVEAQLTVIDQTGCNLQMNGYLNTFDPNSICTGYLADAGLSSGIPPSPTMWSANVPAGDTLIVVVHSVNGVDELGCNYEITVSGECIPVEARLQSFEVE